MKHNIMINTMDDLNDGLNPPDPKMSDADFWAFKSRHQDNPLLHYLNSDSFSVRWNADTAHAILYACELVGMTPFDAAVFMSPYVVQPSSPYAPGPLKLSTPKIHLIKLIYNNKAAELVKSFSSGDIEADVESSATVADFAGELEKKRWAPYKHARLGGLGRVERRAKFGGLSWIVILNLLTKKSDANDREFVNALIIEHPTRDYGTIEFHL